MKTNPIQHINFNSSYLINVSQYNYNSESAISLGDITKLATNRGKLKLYKVKGSKDIFVKIKLHNKFDKICEEYLQNLGLEYKKLKV